MKKTLLASALTLAFSGLAYATANDQESGRNGVNTSTDTTNVTVNASDSSTHNRSESDSSVHNRTRSGDADASGDRSVATNNGSTASFSNAFNTTKVVALSKLEGT